MFLALKRELHELRSRVTGAGFHATAGRHEHAPQDAEERASTPGAAVPARRSVNMSKRSQVIRLSRRGEPVETIATTLGLPRREVDAPEGPKVSAASVGGATS